jgi:hypothetical protein
MNANNVGSDNMNTPNVTITAEQAFALITEGVAIHNRIITGTLSFEETEFNFPVVLVECEVENLKAVSVQFNKAVRFVNCHFEACDFPSCFFPGGLEIVACSFDNYLDFQCGGHNKPTTKISICDTVFRDFVNFFDCMYEGPVIVTKNRFEKGTNLLGNQNQPYVVSFGDVVTIEENEGELNINGEGGDETVQQPSMFPINLN